MKEDEAIFFKVVARYCRNSDRKLWPRDIINSTGFPINYKRAWYLLEKWSTKGWYEYGVSLDLGWITEEGIKKYEII